MRNARRRRWFGWRTWGILVGVLALLVGAFWLALQPKAPRFRTDFQVGTGYRFLTYPHLSPVPFSGGLTWVLAYGATNEVKIVLLEVGSGKVLGEFENGEVLLLDGVNRRALCKSLPQRRTRVQGILYGILERLMRRPLQGSTEQIYWMLDLESGKATLIDRLPEPQNASILVPSPQSTKGYLEDAFDFTQYSYRIRLFDLEAGQVEFHEVPGWPAGWWDDEKLLCASVVYSKGKGSRGTFTMTGRTWWLYDSSTGEKTVFISGEKLENWLKAQGIPSESESIAPFRVWDGSAYQFYVTDTHLKWKATNSFLAELKRDGTLGLVTNDFRFGWHDDFHPTEPFYIFTGRTTGQNSSAVFLRNLETDKEKVIVLPTGPYHSVPRFYENQVVFVRSNMLWKTDLGGSNMVLLFPPPLKR